MSDLHPVWREPPRPERVPLVPIPETRIWPTNRDAVLIAVGLLVVLAFAGLAL